MPIESLTVVWNVQLIQATNAGPLQQNFQEMSITAWITAPEPRGNITDAMLVGRGERVWELVWNNASQLVLHIGDVNVTSDSLVVPRDGTWHFVACTYMHSTPHGAKVQFFVDGHKPMVHELPADQMQIPVATTELTIGGSLTSDKFFKVQAGCQLCMCSALLNHLMRAGWHA